MAYLLDTCAASELSKKVRNPRVVDALLAIPRHELYISAISIGEIRHGIERLLESASRTHLERWLGESILPVFGERILPVDTAVAFQWGRLLAVLEASGQKMEARDSLIAAVAITHNLTIVTRNVNDFAHCGACLYNPWE